MIKFIVFSVFTFAIIGFQNIFHLVVPIEFNTSICVVDTIPQLNTLILTFVNSNLKKKVGRGECWDLASEALNHSGAKWNQQYKFGKEVKYQKEIIYPGDIIQFENVLVKYEKNGQKIKENMDHHTAIIYQIIENGNYIIAHQNTDFSGRKVGLSPINLQNISRGHFKIYRPVTF